MKKISSIIIFLLCINIISKADYILPDKIKEAHNLFYLGQYKNSIKVAETISRKGNKNISKSLSIVFYNCLLAKNHYQLGNSEFCRINMKEALDEFDNITKRDEKKTALWFIAETYFDNNYIFISKQWVEKAEKIENKVGENLWTNIHLDLLKVKILSKQGFYNESLNLIDKQKNYISEIINSKKFVTGLTKPIKLSKSELRILKEIYGQLLIFNIDILYNRGSFDAIEAQLPITKYWIKKNLGKKHELMVDYYRIFALQQNLKNKNQKELNRNILKTIDINKSKPWFSKSEKFGIQSKKIIDIKSELITLYLDQERLTVAKREESNTNLLLKRYYGENNSVTQYYKSKFAIERFISENQFEKAEEKADLTLSDTNTTPHLHPHRINMLQMLYEVKVNSGQIKSGSANKMNALQILQEIIKNYKIIYGEEAPIYHSKMVEYADYVAHINYNFKEAEKIYENSLLKILAPELDQNSIVLIDLINNLGKFYTTIEKYKQAKESFEKTSISIQKNFGDLSVQYADQLVLVSKLYTSIGEYKTADTTAGIALAIYEKNNEKNSLEYINALINKASIETKLSIFDLAQKHITKAKVIFKKLKYLDESLEDMLYEQIAYIEFKSGKVKEAEDLANLVIKNKKAYTEDNNPDMIESYTLMGQIYLFNAKYPESEKSTSKALKTIKDVFGVHTIKYANALFNSAKINFEIGDYDKSQNLLETIIDIYTKKFSDKHLFLIEPYDLLAKIQSIKNEPFANINKTINKSLSIARTELDESHPLYAEILKNMAEIYLKNDKVNEAEDLLNEATSIIKEKFGRKNIFHAQIYSLRGDINIKKKNYRDAEINYDKALKLYSKYLSKNHPLYVSTVSQKAKYYYIVGNYKQSLLLTLETTQKYLVFIEKYFPTLSEREKMKFWNLIKSDFEFFNFLTIKYYSEDPNLLSTAINYSMMTKSLLLNNSLKIKNAILSSKDTVLIRKYDNYTNKRKLLTEMLNVSDENNSLETTQSQQQIENDILSLEKELSKYTLSFGTIIDKKANDWKKLRDSLHSNEVIVELIRSRIFTNKFTDSVQYLALIIKKNKDNNPTPVVLKNGLDLEKKYLKYYRNVVRFKEQDENSYLAYWKDIDQKIPAGSKVYLSPDGVYNQINIESLVDEQQNYILDKYPIYTLGNLKEFTHLKSKITSKEAFLVGNPLFYQTDNHTHIISSLPGAEEEIKGVENVLNKSKVKTTTLFEATATEEAIKNCNSPKIFHIATHGFFRELSSRDQSMGFNEELTNPLNRSGLLLTNAGGILTENNTLNFNSQDGILTANEAMNMNLENTDLVVLSACETGLGEIQAGEGVYGLQRSFLVAGAKTLIMSLFKVDDEVTKELMQLFYQYWLTSNDKHQSLIKAKKDIKLKYPEPIYWASFVMIGKE